MSKEKFTPGFWFTKWNGEKHEIHGNRSTAGPIAFVRGGGPGLSTDEGKANAHLIAAAPALYEVAKFSLSVLKANPMELSERMAIEKLEAALVLAEGK